MNITVFTQNFGEYIGGGRLYCWHIIHALAMRGHNIKISTTQIPLFDREYADFPGKENITIYKDNFYNTRDSKILKELSKCDLVICMPVVSADYGMAFAGIYKKKTLSIVLEPISAIYNAISSGLEIPFSERSESILSDFTKQIVKSDCLLFSTKDAVLQSKNDWIPAYKNRMEYLWNSFMINKASEIKLVDHKDRENSVVFISRTVPYKGYGDIPFVFGKMKNKPKIYFITGFRDRMDSKQRDFFKFCKDAGLNIEILDKIDEKTKFEILARSRALFFPSRFEGFGLPIIESLYLNTPVFAYELDVIKEHSGDYIHFANFNDHNDMANKVLEIYDNDELLFSKMSGARQHVESFASLDVFSNKLDKLCCEIVGLKKAEISKVIEQKKETKNNNCVLILDSTENLINESLKNQEFKGFDIRYLKGNEFVDFNQYDNVIIADSNIILNPKTTKEMFLLLNAYDFVYSNYTIKDCKIGLPDFHENVLIVEPDFISNLIACKAKFLENFVFDQYWELKLGLKFSDKKWHNCRLNLFNAREKVDYSSFRVDQILNSHFKDKNVFVERYKGNFRNFALLGKDLKKACVICLFRTDKYIHNFLKSVKENVDIYLGYHCIDGCDYDLIEGLFEDKRIKAIEKFRDKYNFSAFNNHIFGKHCKDYDYIVICNDDIVLEERAIENIISTFSFDEKIGIVGSQLYYDNENFKFGSVWDRDKTLQHVGIKLLKDRLCTHLNARERSGHLSNNYLRKLEAVTFAFVAIKKECYLKIMLDENLPNYYNDIDFCIRAGLDEWHIYYNPLARAIHFETATIKEFSIGSDQEHKILFQNKHKTVFERCITYQQLRALQLLGF